MLQRLQYLLSDVPYREQVTVLLKVRLHMGCLPLYLHEQLKQYLGHVFNDKQFLRVVSCGCVILHFGRFFAGWLSLNEGLLWLHRLEGG